MRPTIRLWLPNMSASPPVLRLGGLQRAAAILGTVAAPAAGHADFDTRPDPVELEALVEALAELCDALDAEDLAEQLDDLLAEHSELGPRARRLLQTRSRLQEQASRLLARARAARWTHARAPVREAGRLAVAVSRHVAAEHALWSGSVMLDLGGGADG